MARSLRVLLIFVATVGSVSTLPPVVPSAGAAELDRKGKSDAKMAMRLYKEGNYDDAAKIFSRLSVAYPDMLVFVRNLGACYYYLRRWEPAISNLRDYEHRKKDIPPDDRAEIAGWIGEMERLRDLSMTPAAAPAPGAPSGPPTAATGPGIPAPTPTAGGAPGSPAAAAPIPPGPPVGASEPGGPAASPSAAIPVPTPSGGAAAASPPAVARPGATAPLASETGGARTSEGTPSAPPAGEAVAPPAGPTAQPPGYPPGQYPYPPTYPPSQYNPQAGYPQPTYATPTAAYPATAYPQPSSAYAQGYPAAAYPPAGQVAAPAPAPSHGVGRKVAAWILSMSGIATIAAGGFFTFKALDDFSKVQKKYDPKLADEGKKFALAQWVCYGAGGALLLTGLIIGATGSSSSPGVALAPAVGPGRAGATLSGSF
jgi:hypothetical protein